MHVRNENTNGLRHTIRLAVKQVFTRSGPGLLDNGGLGGGMYQHFETCQFASAFHDKERLEALNRYDILDTPEEEAFSDLAQLAAEILKAPMAVISMIAGDRQWFKARVGVEVSSTPISDSICAHALLQPGLCVIPDLTDDERFRKNPFVAVEKGVRFYAGARLDTPSGVPLGMICVLDREPRPQGITPRQGKMLQVLASQVVAQLELRRECSDRRRTEVALRKEEELTRTIVDNSPDCIKLLDPSGRILFISAQGARTLELSGCSAAVGRCWPEFFPVEEKEKALLSLEQALGGETVRFTAYGPTAQGTPKWWDNTVTLVRGTEQEEPRLLVVSREATERVQFLEALKQSEERFRLAAKTAAMGIWDYDAAEARIRWSDELKQILGVSRETPETYSGFLDLVHPEDCWKVEDNLSAALDDGRDANLEKMLRIRRASDGQERWLATSGCKSWTPWGQLSRVMITVRDVTEENEAQARVQWSATHDSLTRLPNRALFQQELEHAVSRARSSTGKVGLLMLDVDHFKQINDMLGHDAGDLFLQAFAERLRGSVRSSDLVARLGGDEFAVILRELRDEDEIQDAVERVMRRLREPFIHAGRILDCRATIGACVYPDQSDDPDELLKNADIALYAAKDAGRSRVMVYRPAMRADMQRRTSMLNLAREALDKGWTTAFYQPKVALHSGEVKGFEALLRWRHPRLGIQLPGTISAAFEDLDLANALSDRMLDQVVSDMRRWLENGLDFGHVAINASAAEFRQDDFAERVLARLRSAEIPTRHLELEVTETVFLGRGAEFVDRALKTLSSEGIKIALDDFGTGYASLSHLKQFPVDTIKIDRSFVSDLEEDPDDAAIIRAVLNLGHSLGIQIVAEGVETPVQAAYLWAQGCDLGQGHLFGKPLPSGRVPLLLKNWNPAKRWRSFRPIRSHQSKIGNLSDPSMPPQLPTFQRRFERDRKGLPR